MNHKKLKVGWQFPAIPDGYSKATVVIGSSGDIKLDFIGEDQNSFFSLDSNMSVPKCDWPWVDGFNPQEEDWTKLGFVISRMRDNCFSQPDRKSMFADWLHKG